MLRLDTWQEILDTVRKNKLRTMLTGFSVAWGILILVVLLGSGQGLAHGVEYGFRDDAVNTIFMRAGQTSVPYRGLKPGRNIQFTNQDYEVIRQSTSGIDHITGRFFIKGNLRVSYGGQTTSYSVRSVHPDHQYLEKTIMVEGRYINAVDLSEYRKVAVISEKIQKQLFEGKPAIGEYIKVNGVPFQVVGIYTDEGPENEQEVVYLPITTAQRTFNGTNTMGMLMMTVGDAGVDESQAIAQQVKRRMAESHDFDPVDERAIWLRNGVVAFQRFVNLMGGIRAFVWVIGVGTLLAGVVGVSNIMLIAVKERTREIGVRKAIGATPASVMGLVLQEAVLITGVAGYLGLVTGVLVLEAMSRGISGSDFFRHPEVHIGVAISATVLLVAAGTIAGFFPARRAAAIRPIEALREE